MRANLEYKDGPPYYCLSCGAPLNRLDMICPRCDADVSGITDPIGYLAREHYDFLVAVRRHSLSDERLFRLLFHLGVERSLIPEVAGEMRRIHRATLKRAGRWIGAVCLVSLAGIPLAAATHVGSLVGISLAWWGAFVVIGSWEFIWGRSRISKYR